MTWAQCIYDHIWLLRRGAGMESVKELLGHASISTTLDTYGHLTELVIRLQAARVSQMGRFRKGRGEDIAVDMRVRVCPHTETEARGVIVEDFGDTGGYGVDIGTRHIASPALRWAVQSDNGELVFFNSADIVVDD